jgi:chromate transporter
MIASVFTHLFKFAGVKAVIGGIKPAIVALILSTAATMFLSLVFGIKNIGSPLSFDYKALIVLAFVYAISFAFKKWRKKAISPILLIILSGVLGMVLY